MNAVLHSFAYCFDYLREQVADVAGADMVAQPNRIMNHPAWVIGHLTLSCQMIGEDLRVPAWLPDDWVGRYGEGSIPVADASVYEPKETSLALLGDAQSRIMRAVERLDDSFFDQPFPTESYRDIFPTTLHALMQVLVGHPAYHIGQLVLWRRAMGLPRMQRSFQ